MSNRVIDDLRGVEIDDEPDRAFAWLCDCGHFCTQVQNRCCGCNKGTAYEVLKPCLDCTYRKRWEAK